MRRLQYSPYGHRVHLALEEVKADYKFYTLNVMNKPEWFTAQVNPAGKVRPSCRFLRHL